MLLSKESGLKEYIDTILKTDTEMYYDAEKGKVSVILQSGVCDNVDKLKIQIANYISRHMLINSYRVVDIYS